MTDNPDPKNLKIIQGINAFCISIIIQKDKICSCKIKACFHSGQMDAALKVLKLTNVPFSKIKQLMQGTKK